MSKQSTNINWFVVLLIILFFVGSACLICSTVPTKGEATNDTQHFHLDLPADFQTAISVTNNRNGVIVGYLDKDGNLTAVQYSGANFEREYRFHFEVEDE